VAFSLHHCSCRWSWSPFHIQLCFLLDLPPQTIFVSPPLVPNAVRGTPPCCPPWLTNPMAAPIFTVATPSVCKTFISPHAPHQPPLSAVPNLSIFFQPHPITVGIIDRLFPDPLPKRSLFDPNPGVGEVFFLPSSRGIFPSMFRPPAGTCSPCRLWFSSVPLPEIVKTQKRPPHTIFRRPFSHTFFFPCPPCHISSLAHSGHFAGH